ncbi:hypothetical protein K488DRAFT_53084 [Vararia minispora EC-137]|uniref:Uncharacterized protein n=1 Tax=Vararia minispora EC-137 TaxID=1314806 RepID=A0ACB8QGK9_9AGAM|nr:hypothetical protein K488DRAFT_53084 [Vararia minispora EC-137]
MSAQPFTEEELSRNPTHNVPSNLVAATNRLNFPPSYIVVGAYRLLSDKSLLIPVWNKCKHALLRGVSVAVAYAFVTFRIQRKLVQLFWMKSPFVTGLSDDTFFGYAVPFDLATYATYVSLATQASSIIYFFMARNLRIARTRAWEQTVASRHKSADFFGPYVEEWNNPPVVDEDRWAALAVARGRVATLFFKRVALMAVRLTIPVGGLLVSSWFEALDTASYLHRPYFEAKKMTKREIATFIAEHQADYRSFGFVAALVESIPFCGMLLSVSNGIGAAMWAFDLEKRQHYVAELRAKRSL